LLDVAGWTKAAERAADNWDDVVQAIDDQCPEWRDQIVACRVATTSEVVRV
jgi:hypothetical protein